MKKNILFLALVAVMCCACDKVISTYEVKVSGTVVDTKGQPVANAPVKITDRQTDQNTMFGGWTDAYIERQVGTTTTDENGYFELNIQTERRCFDISVVQKTEDWERFFAQSAWVRCECTAGKTEYVQDLVAKTENDYYTGTDWQNALEVSTLTVELVDTIHIRLTDGGTILSAGVWFDEPYETKVDGQTVLRHSFSSGMYMYYHVDGGDFCIPAGLQEYDLAFKIDTTKATWCTIPYAERCYLKVESVQENQDRNGYYIPLTLN